MLNWASRKPYPDSMARPSTPEKEPGRIKQMWQVFQMTRRYDTAIMPLLLAAFLVPTGLRWRCR